MRWINCGALSLLGAVLLLAAPVLAQTPPQGLTLQEATSRGLVRLDKLRGTSSDGNDYTQPLVRATLVNSSPGTLTLELPLGSQLQPVGKGPSMIALGFAQQQISLDPGATTDVGLIAFTTVVTSHPTASSSFTLAEPTNDAALLQVLQAINTRGGVIGTNLAPQIAVWRVATKADCATTDRAIQTTFEVSIGCSGPEAQNVAALMSATPIRDTPTGVLTETTITTSPLTPTPGSGSGNSVFPLVLTIFGTITMLVAVVIGVFLYQNRGKVPPASGTNKPDGGVVPPGSQHIPPIPGVDPGPRPGGRTPGPTSPNPAGPSYQGDTGQVRPGSRASVPTTPLRPSDLPSNPSPPAPIPGAAVGGTASPSGQPTAPPPPDPGASATVPPTPAASPSAIDPTIRLGSAGSGQPGRRFAIPTEVLTAPALPDLLRAPQFLLVMTNPAVTASLPVYPFTLLSGNQIQQSEIFAPDASISTPHCMIRSEQQGWTISDLASLNGTLLNGSRVTEKGTLLPDGALVQLGTVRLRFKSEPCTLTQVEPEMRPPPVFHFDPGDQPYWLLTAHRLHIAQISAQTVSTPHALVTFDDGWTVRDLRSSRGTQILRPRTAKGQQQIQIQTVPQRILLGDELRISPQVSGQTQGADLPQIGPYRPLWWLGRGGAASLLLARRADDPHGAPVVLKLLASQDATIRQAFTREGEVLIQLRQAGVARLVQCHEQAQDEAFGPYLVLDYVQGATLQAVLRTSAEQSLPLGVIVAIGLLIGEALVALHQRGWIHCDIKPENILISQRGEVFLSDLGALTKVGEQPVFATSAYAPPEFRSQRPEPATPAADVYSLGAVLYEMLMGMRYYHLQLEKTPQPVEAQTITRRCVPTSGVNAPPANGEPLAALINQCLQPHQSRYQQIEDLINALGPHQQSPPGQGAALAALVQRVDALL